MDAYRKRARTGSTSADDRLSALPDALIHTIMSFLKAHQVVQTCVLAKRWMHLWRSVPYLDIDLPEFNSKVDDKAAIKARYQKFVDFADYLLFHRQQDGSLLDTFRLHTNAAHTAKPEDAGRWVRRGLMCSPRVLHIHQSFGEYYPQAAYIPWELGSGPSFSRRLSKLHLVGLSLNSSFVEQIISVYDVLEELELKKCEISFQKITSPSLKNLIVDSCDATYRKELIITAPHLASVHLDIKNYYGSVVLVLNEMLSLRKASIHNPGSYLGDVVHDNQCQLLSSLSNVTSLELLGFRKRLLPDNEPRLACVHLNFKTSYGSVVVVLNEMSSLTKASINNRSDPSDVVYDNKCELLSSLSNVTSLELLGFHKRLLPDEEPVEFPTFKNLTSLLLDDCELGDKFQLLRHFLQNSPNLERLIVKCCQFSKASKRGKGKARSKTSSQCQDAVHLSCLKLKYIEITYEHSYNLGPLVNVLLDASDSLPKNTIRLTKVETTQ